jgi:hypothetical protein
MRKFDSVVIIGPTIPSPNPAFGRVLDMRDRERDGEYMDFVYNSLWMQVTTAVDDALHRFVNSGGEEPKGSANESIATRTTLAETHSNEGGEDPIPTKKPSKLPPPSLNPNTATNDESNPIQESLSPAEIEPGGKIKPAATLEEIATPKKDGEAGTLNFQTPATSEMAPESLRNSVGQIEKEMDQRRLSFDNYASKLNLSSIEDESDQEMPTSTKKLKKELNETQEKTTWEDRVASSEHTSPSKNASSPAFDENAEAVGQLIAETRISTLSPMVGAQSPESIAGRLSRGRKNLNQLKNEKDTT